MGIKKQVSIVKKRAALHQRYDVTTADLPLSCPMPDMRLWDAHPRVYLPIAATGHVVCPYCGAEYFLHDAEAVTPTPPTPLPVSIKPEDKRGALFKTVYCRHGEGGEHSQ